jgi:hypothetical protein
MEKTASWPRRDWPCNGCEKGGEPCTRGVYPFVAGKAKRKSCFNSIDSGEKQAKDGERKRFEPLHAVYGGKVKNAVKMQVLGALILFGAGCWLAGCKPAPDLTQPQALAMIQAKYDQAPGVPFDISVDDRGMQQGVRANYWVGTKRYPNGYWGDFKLTPDGEKALKLASGGDVIQWRPSGPGDSRYATVVVPLAASHLKARDLGEIENLGDNKTVLFVEDVNLDGMPPALQNMAHSPDNKLSTKRLATFALVNGAWSLKSIE